MTVRQFVYMAKHRIAGAAEYLRTGRVESFDDFERVNQIMHEGGFADRREAYEYVADELARLWEEAHPSQYAYWEAPSYHEMSHLAFRPSPDCGDGSDLVGFATHHGPWCEEGSMCDTCFGDAIAKRHSNRRV